MRSCHPSALPLLCLVQACERFAFFAMLPLFVLYLHHRHGFTEPAALLILGIFNALSYVSGLPGGLLTDRQIGPTSALLAGTVLLTIGYGALATDRGLLLWPALVLLVLGHGLFRPSIAALFSSLEPSIEGRRERNFLWQYLACNLAGVAAPLCAGVVSTGQRWSELFRMATIAMLVGTFVLSVTGQRLFPKRQAHRTSSPSIETSMDITTRWRAVILLCSLAVVFWLTALQAGGSLVVFAESYTLRSVAAIGRTIAIGPTAFASLHALLVLLLLPLFMSGSAWLRRHGRDPSTPAKMVWGYVATAAAFILLAAAGLCGSDGRRVSPAWLTGCYILMSLAELLLGPFGMSLVTRIAPPNRTGQAVGLWFAAAAVGNVLAGALGLLWGRWPNHRYFALLALLSLGAALVLFFRLSPLERLLTASRRDEGGGRP